MCIEITNIFVTLILDNIFEITLEKDYVCSYVFPICDESEDITRVYH